VTRWYTQNLSQICQAFLKFLNAKQLCKVHTSGRETDYDKPPMTRLSILRTKIRSQIRQGVVELFE